MVESSCRMPSSSEAWLLGGSGTAEFLNTAFDIELAAKDGALMR